MILDYLLSFYVFSDYRLLELEREAVGVVLHDEHLLGRDPANDHNPAGIVGNDAANHIVVDLLLELLGQIFDAILVGQELVI